MQIFKPVSLPCLFEIAKYLTWTLIPLFPERYVYVFDEQDPCALDELDYQYCCESVNGGRPPIKGRKFLLFDDAFSDQRVAFGKYYMFELSIGIEKRQ